MKKLLALALCALTLVFACAAAMADASITFQMGGEPECMDPTINDYSSGSYALQSLFRGLYKYDADGALVPAMAESYEVSEDGCTYTFKLKEGLKWSDGSPLTAHDFEYSWKRVLNPDVGSETAYTLYSVIKDGYECFVSKTVAADDLPIRALDDTTFQVELKAPASYFITLTASTAFMPVCKANVEKYGEDWSSSPETYVCNGPFMLADMKKDESFTFVKNPNYYNADEVKIDTVKYVFLNAPETVRMAFDNGELDIATSVNSAGDEHEHQRIELQAHNDDAALEAVDVAEPEAECVEQEIGDGSVAAAEHDPCVSADERRAHRADENQDLQRAGEANLHRGHDVGQRGCQQHGNQRHGRGELEAAPDRALIIFLVEDLGEILPGETAVLADDALAEHADKRIEQEQHVEDADADGDDHPQIPANLFAGRFSGHRSQPLSSGWSCRLR